MKFAHARARAAAAASYVRWWQPATLWLAHAAAGAAGIIPATWRHAVTITTALAAAALLVLIEVRVGRLRRQLDAGGAGKLAVLPGGKDEPAQASARLDDCEAMIDALFDLLEIACADRGIDLGPLPRTGLRLVGGTAAGDDAV